jgi:hypothetical protein
MAYHHYYKQILKIIYPFKTFDLILDETTYKICTTSREEAERFILANKHTVLIRNTSSSSIEFAANKNKRPDIITRMTEVKKVVQVEIEDESETDAETARRVLMEFRHDNVLPMVTVSFYSFVKTMSDGTLLNPGICHTQILSLDHFYTTIENIKKFGPTILYGEDKPITDFKPQRIPGHNFGMYAIVRKIPDAPIKECLVPGS